MMPKLRAAFFLALVYLALTANLELSNIILGLLLSLSIVLLLRPALRDSGWHFLPTAVWALPRYVITLAIDLIVSGVQVALIVLNPALPIKQGNIAITTQCESEMAQALSAHAITLTPGELVVEMADEGQMYTHTLDTSHAEEEMAGAQHEREAMLRKIIL